MATDLVSKIRELKYPGLLRLWDQVVNGATPGWGQGQAFEYLILRAFELEQLEVQYPFSVNLPTGINEQIDGVIYSPQVAALAESKDRGAMNIEPIAKLRSQLQRRPSSVIGVLFSRGGFTLPALALSQHMTPQTILLWHGDEIEHALKKRKMAAGLVLKYRMAVELGVPDFSLLRKGVL
jgi:hypothetical protein